MLAVSSLRDSTKDERQSEMGSFSIEGDEFLDFSGGSLLDSIDFDDFFVGINDGDVLPDLEMDNEILAEFSLSGGEESLLSVDNNNNNNNSKVEDDKVGKITTSGSDGGSDVGSGASSNNSNQGEDVMSKSSECSAQMDVNSSSKGGDKGKKSSSNQSKNAQGKRKVKVDWTPDLHRRFVQAVEQLGVDKAVPSRILEIMGIDCLTRHNIASHLQKYRSHRKHLLAREAEAVNWNQRRQMYGGAAAVAPTIGFPPVAPMPPHFRPLHVWGHPSVDQSVMHMWPKHVAPPHPPPTPPTWPPDPPPHPQADPSFWHSHHQRAPNPLMAGAPCFPPPMAAARYPAPPVPCIPPRTLYKGDPSIGVPTTPVGQNIPKPPADFQPSKESIDAAIGDVLSKPWLPLPIGLKQPSVDCVLVELQRQGISKIPPTTT